MKIVHLESGRHLYGGALQVIFLLRGLRQLAGQQVLICPQGSAVAQEAKGLVEKLYTIPMRGELDFRLISRLRAIFRHERPDLVHIHSRRGADFWGGWAAWREGIPAILSRRVDNPEPPWLARWKYRRYRRIITISQGIRQVLLSEGLPTSQIVCVPSAVDTDHYRPNRERQWLQAEFSLAKDERTVGMAAQFIGRKGHRVLLEAIPAILKAHPRTHFLLFGKGPLRESIEQLCVQKNLQHQVSFPGFRTDMHKILPALDLVVHPAFMEGLGVALLQAAACGVPIVASRVGGIPEIVRDGINGTLTPAGEPHALAQAVNDLLADTEQAKSFGEAGRQIVLADFSIAAMVEGNYRVYKDVLGLN